MYVSKPHLNDQSKSIKPFKSGPQITRTTSCFLTLLLVCMFLFLYSQVDKFKGWLAVYLNEIKVSKINDGSFQEGSHNNPVSKCLLYQHYLNRKHLSVVFMPIIAANTMGWPTVNSGKNNYSETVMAHPGSEGIIYSHYIYNSPGTL